MKIKIIIISLILILISGCSHTAVSVTDFPRDNQGNVEVSIQDQFTEIIDLKLSKKIADINITLNTSLGDNKINITSNVLPSIDDLVCLKENKSFYQGLILIVNPLGGNQYEITLDTPLDYAYTTAGGCSIRNDNWAVIGSLENPQVFTLSPAKLNNVSWDITRMILICRGDGVGPSNEIPDSSSFFTQEPITNGIYFRSIDGVTKNIFNAKDNFHLTGETFDLDIVPKNRLGKYSVSTRRTFNGDDKNGVTVRLDSITSDTFELVVQDDLTGMDECHAYVQGHVVE